VLRGLATVHHAGIVHRDLKPENIFLVKERDDKLIPKLLDFGISRSLEPDTRRSAVTTTEGMIIGTPQYMSPEQARGLRDIDQRTDLYSLGVVLFEALTGFVPFDSRNTGDLLMQVIRDPAQPLYELVPQIGESLCHVVDKVLAKDPAQRYADATAMQAALVAAARRIPSTLDRRERMFPPPAIGGNNESKRAGVGRGVRSPTAQSLSIPAAPRAARGPSKLAELSPWHSASDAPTQDRLAQVTPAVAEQSASKLATGAAAVRGWSAPRRWLPIAVSSLGLVVVAVAATLAWTYRDAGRDDSGFIVVQAPAPAPPPSTQTAAHGSVPVEAEPESQTKPAPEPPKVRKQVTAEAPDPLRLMAAEVARAFARQKVKVTGCLDAHPEDMQSAPQLTINVTVTAAGKASSAQLLPETIANKPVSGCVTEAVLSMSFPPQTQPTTFRVPLLWHRK
jgi:eukaryotic-like serine/threonine-protein kinase